MTTTAGFLGGFATATVVATGSVPADIPNYSTTEIWLGSAILLCTLLALLVALLHDSRPAAHRHLHLPHRHRR